MLNVTEVSQLLFFVEGISGEKKLRQKQFSGFKLQLSLQYCARVLLYRFIIDRLLENQMLIISHDL